MDLVVSARVAVTLCVVYGVLGSKELHMAWMVPENYHMLNGSSSVGSLAVALKTIQDTNILPGYHINVTWVDSECSSKKTIGRITELLFKKKIDVIIGPPCSAAMASAADLASYMDIPIFGWVSRQVALDDKERFSTLIRLSSPTSSLGNVFVTFCRSMGWFNVVMMSTVTADAKSLSDSMLYTFNSPNNEDFSLVRHYSSIAINASEERLSRIFSQIKNEARVICLVVPNEHLRHYLLVAHSVGMTNGDYQFLFMEQTIPDRRELEILQGEGIWKSGDEHDEDAKQAFRNLLFFTYANISDFEMLTDATSTAYDDIFKDRSDMPAYSAKRDRFTPFLNDAVVLYATALKESLDKYNSTKGSDLYRICANTVIHFNGMSGEVHIGRTGDRLPNFVVWDMGPNYKFRSTTTIITRMTETGLNRTMISHAPILWGDGRSTPSYYPPDRPPCGFFNEDCPKDTSLLIIITSVLGFVMMAFVVGALIFYRWWRSERDISNLKWKVPSEALDYNFRKKKGTSLAPFLEGHEDDDVSVRSAQSEIGGKTSGSAHASHESIRDTSSLFHQYTTVARYKGNLVAIKKIWKTRLQADRKLLVHIKELIMMKHSNLALFLGVCTESKSVVVLWEYCSKGSVYDILENTDMKLDSMFQFSIAIDICTGLEYLHSSPLKYHGNLKSTNCLVDNRWVCKLTDFGLGPIRKRETDTSEQLTDDEKAEKLFWLAPELLRVKQREETYTPTPLGDIYAFGIILKEIICLNKPYSEEQKLSPKEIIRNVAHPKDRLMRPVIVETHDEYVGFRQPFYKLVHSCWSEDPSCRPSSRRALRRITRLNPYRSSNMLDNMVMMMERYSNHLEELVADRTAQLEEEKRKTDMLLYSMLPQKVADNLKAGKLVQAEAFQAATVYFSDIVSFTDLASGSTPMEIVELLNTLYTLFDDTIKIYDVYKVETIGDAYMIASGVPVPNDKHHLEMADAALSLLKAVLGYVIPHRPDIQLKIRIGVHSGPVVAGVVGLTMPRYCLFGDTVNTASRMESNGLPLKIHLSPSIADLLRRNPLYRVVDRGLVDIKGKGRMNTSWLQGKTGLYDVPEEDIYSIHKPSNASDITFSSQGYSSPTTKSTDIGQNLETRPGSDDTLQPMSRDVFDQ